MKKSTLQLATFSFVAQNTNNNTVPIKKQFRRNCVLTFGFLFWFFTGLAQSPPDFGAASNFALFTVTGAVANTATSHITGNIGTNAGAITGFQAPSVVDGYVHVPDSLTAQAASDLIAAYNQLHAMVATNTTHAAIFGSGETLNPGIYALTTDGTITETLTLDGLGNTDALFVFKIGGAFTTGAHAKVILVNGARAANVFWIAEGAIAMAAGTTMKGTLIANNAAISMAAGGTINGRLFSTTGAVAIDGSTTIATGDGDGLRVMSNQIICTGRIPDDLTLNQTAANVVKWQKSSDDLFTTPTDIANTTHLLAGSSIGNLSETAFFRAVIQTGETTYANSQYAAITVYSRVAPNFGIAANFAMFTISGAAGNTGMSHITGDIGSNLGIISGFEAPTVVNGNFYNANAVTLQAGSDLLLAYEQLHVMAPTNTSHLASFGVGETLQAGVYSVASAGTMTGTLYLDAQGNSNALFVFLFNGAFSTGANTSVVLLNGALSQNIFWVSQGALALGAGTVMQGTILANEGAASMGAGSTLFGSIYSTAGAVASYNSTIYPLGNSNLGTISPDQDICLGNLPIDIVLSGASIHILKWQRASDEFFESPIDIDSNSTTLTADMIGSPIEKTYYRAVMQKGFCGTAFSASASIDVLQLTKGGTIMPNQVICKATIPGNLTLSGSVGQIIRWESSPDATFATAITAIPNTTATLDASHLGIVYTTQYYRAVVQSGNCTIENSDSIEVLIKPTLTYDNGLWNGVPDEKTSAIINVDLTLTQNLHVCSCRVAGNAILVVPAGISLIVEKNVVVDLGANMIIENNGSLVQIDDAGTAGGKITVHRNATPMKQYDYSYWSAPVKDWKLNELSPNTLSDKFYSFNPLINNWSPANGGNQIMEPAKGYIVRAPQGWSVTNETGGVYGGVFNGTPNTGIVPVPIIKGSGSYNLIGNPYPSAIDIDLFLKDSLNSGIVEGTIYLWTHNTAISSGIPGNSFYNYASDDYAKYNLTGGVRSAAPAITGGSTPTGMVASGQAFFIAANTSLPNGTFTAFFNNSMRVTGSNGQFYRTGTYQNQEIDVHKNRMWLTLSNTTGAYNQTLLGYLDGATNGYDRLYDGKTFAAGNVVSLYSISGIDHYSIQGRALPFDVSHWVPLGYATTISGNFSIGIETFDGLFLDQPVYLMDHLTNNLHHLTNAPYSFTTEVGTFNNRFELRFTDDTLANNHINYSPEEVIAYQRDGKIWVSTAKTPLTEIKVYDMTGRLLAVKSKISAGNAVLDVDQNNRLLVVSVTLENNMTTVKKIGIGSN